MHSTGHAPLISSASRRREAGSASTEIFRIDSSQHTSRYKISEEGTFIWVGIFEASTLNGKTPCILSGLTSRYEFAVSRTGWSSASNGIDELDSSLRTINPVSRRSPPDSCSTRGFLWPSRDCVTIRLWNYRERETVDVTNDKAQIWV